MDNNQHSDAQNTSDCCSSQNKSMDNNQHSDAQNTSDCCSSQGKKFAHYVQMKTIGSIDSATSAIPQVSTTLDFSDILGAFKSRWNIRRMYYRVEPGIYAVGKPNEDSPVFVSANYKMSFDYLRRELKNIDAWIMVIDTKGINVWCAAGKGTFGTDELATSLKNTKLEEIISHKKLIVPQLGAPGVSAHELKKRTGFSIIYGPVRAKDIPEFLNMGMKTTEEMRQVNFPLYDRLVLVPVEITNALATMLIIALIFLVLSGITTTGYSTNPILNAGIRATIFLLVGFIVGTILIPLFLPYIPGKAFAFKGFLVSLPAIYLTQHYFSMNQYELGAWWLIVPSIASFLAMNFTGATTFTSPSGVQKEMQRALPLQLIGIVIGSILWIISRFVN